jgi:hypothetical protein
MAKQYEPSRYCIRCFYPLNQLEGNQCPECGREFDPANPKTYSKYERIPTWPCWETCVACLLLALLIYLTWDWTGVQELLFGRTARRATRTVGGYYPIMRIQQLVLVSPLIVLIPVLFISGFRKRPRSFSTTVLRSLASRSF